VRGFLSFLCLATLLLAGCGREPAPIRQESFVFGTRVEVLIYGVPEAQGNAAAAEVLREFDRLHRAYHAWQPSELTALNDAIARGQPHPVSAELAGLIHDAQAIAAQGDYLFDPGIGRMIALWGFQSDEFKAVLPDPEQVGALLAAHPSIADLRIEGNRVTSKSRLVALDFGGYLKGVALDRAAALLKARGIANALVNIGGNVIALGAKGGQPWRVGIQHPRSSEVGNAPLATLDLRDGEAIGTSGDYQRYFELAGHRYCHLLDPRSGAPAQGTQAVTLLIPPGAQAGMRSDADSKPLFIVGADWPRMARRLGVSQALRIDADGTLFVTAALRDRLKMESPATRIVVVQ